MKWVGFPQAKTLSEQRKTVAAAPRVLGKNLTQLHCTAAGLSGMLQY